MRRYVLILVLIILPFQFSWAAAARYCQHETVSAKWHLGHHEHRHQSSDQGKPDSEKKSVIDTDCGVCHAVSLQFIYSQPHDIAKGERLRFLKIRRAARFTSLNPRAPDRPQWVRLA
ncbi:cation efflux protein, CzcI family [Cupriavidus plantarum]|uniref:cation efflux protein, CzcI family n=1 Tax=Cupriavidus plantarum TaxID=942865 RepID=UPI00339D8239